jgi:hypothetical protein
VLNAHFNGAILDSHQRFSGPNSRQFAHTWERAQKNSEKIVKKVLENGCIWRFSRAQGAISPSAQRM